MIVFGKTAREVAAAHLSLHLVAHGVGGADRHLDVLGGALADGDAVLTADERR